ncbi:MAG TPA: glycosyltransferase family 9 protein [Pseudonocardiaceae bacterium]|nr:glycosyltransferase family 9 protein [Pseudonocardiaceae bacterium]
MAVRVLIARPDHLGDVLLTLPAATAFRAAFPGTHLAFMLSPSTADVARRCPDIDETLVLPFPPLGATHAVTGWDEVARANAKALRNRFDVAVLCRPDDPWSGTLAKLAEIPIRVGYAVPGMAGFLTHAVQLRAQHHAVIQTLRLMEEAARRLGLTAAGQSAVRAAVLKKESVHFVPSASEEALVRSILLEMPTAGTRPIVFQPGSGWPLKNWDPARWGRLGIEIEHRYGITPLVPGGPGEDALVQAIVDASDASCLGLAGRLSVGALAALYRRSALVVGIDSGPLHLAAMVGTRVVGLYGPLPVQQWAPWSAPQRYRLAQVSLPCSPCDCIFDPPCGIPLNPPCMTGITVDAVLAACSELLP